MTTSTIEKKILEAVVMGRAEPQIYAFTTETVPNYLKVGDTYRPVDVRLNEWRKYFPQLVEELRESAKVSDDSYFRDYAVHRYLEHDKKHTRLTPETFSDIPYYSNEFFKGASKEEVEEAITDIKNTFDNNGSKYQFYKMGVKHDKVENIYKRIENYQPRPNQQETIERFKAALKAKRTNLLMYAVMRFGKSFTSMCCAVEMGATNVLIVSGKADVKEEWKKTVESHKKFKGYLFLTSNTAANHKKELADKKSKKVVFMTLQELCGGKRQTKRSELLNIHYDLLLIDETHYGARAENYGKVLRLSGKEEVNLRKEYTGDDSSADLDDEAIELVKNIKAKVRIHLSGTPYRILMSDEFSEQDIIAFYQFTDIIKDKEAWDEEHFEEAGKEEWDDEHFEEAGKEEWDNPYYGFPQMVRFAFNPNESSMKKMEELKKNGSTAAFTELFMPCAVKKDTQNAGHKKFRHESEVLELMQAIDGSKEDANVFGFLDYEGIKKGQMCHHMVIVLPFRASCDAMQTLLETHKQEFANLGSYEILNISGVENPNAFRSPADVKSKIEKAEDEGRKTITLTVCRMLTGSTVEQWDTMIFLKDTASPQEYDQAIFRLQNQYLREYVSGDGHIIKYNMKPQTLLVDFKPDRMFRLQEQKAQIYNVNTDKDGNSKLKERIREELRISPIIMLNKERNKLVQVEPSDILDAVRDYSRDKSVMDEAGDIHADLALLNIDSIRQAIEAYEPIDSPKGLTIKPVKGEGDDLDTGDTDEGGGDDKEQKSSATKDKSEEHKDEDLSKKIAACYARMLFFACLTPCRVDSLDDILKVMDKGADNKRICANLGLDKQLFRTIRKHINPFILRSLDYKISNINTLMRDETLEPMERIGNALKKFGRMSSSEVITPQHVADEMVATLPIDRITKRTRFLDIASKQGEFAAALYRRYGDAAKNSIYSLPTSPVAYEFTRKVYNILGMPVRNIIADFNSYDLVPLKKEPQKGSSPEEKKRIKEENKQNKAKIDALIDRLKDMKFNAVIGNPPYQVMDGGAGVSATPVYQHFVGIAKQLEPNYVSIIMPAKWYTDGKGLGDFRKEMFNDKHLRILVDFTDSHDCFTTADIAGGVCYFLWNRDEEGACAFTCAHEGQRTTSIRDLSASDTLVRHIEAEAIIEKVCANATQFYAGNVSSRKPYGLATNVVPLPSGDIKLRYNKGIGPYNSSLITKNRETIYLWKVIISRLTAEHAGETDANGQKRILSSLSKLVPGEICTETYLVVDSFETENEANNLVAYLKTRLVRFLIAQLAATQQMTKDKFRFVPLQDFTSSSDIDWSKSIDEIDEQLFDKYGLTDDERAFIHKMIKPME